MHFDISYDWWHSCIKNVSMSFNLLTPMCANRFGKTLNVSSFFNICQCSDSTCRHLVESKEPFIFNKENKGYWWSGDARKQGINRHTLVRFSRNIEPSVPQHQNKKVSRYIRFPAWCSPNVVFVTQKWHDLTSRLQECVSYIVITHIEVNHYDCRIEPVTEIPPSYWTKTPPP